MCGRYYVEAQGLDDPLIPLLNRVELETGIAVKRGEVCPGDTAAVITAREGKLHYSAMRWGFRSREGKLIINARSETAGSKPMFRDSWQNGRCLIPASAYFEWDHRLKPAPKYVFSLPDGRVIYLAGLYRVGESIPEFTVLTREASPMVACFHDRMPLIACRDQASDWLLHGLLRAPQTILRWQAADGV